MGFEEGHGHCQGQGHGQGQGQGQYDQTRTKMHNQMVAVLYRVAQAAHESLFGVGDVDAADDALELALKELEVIRPGWRERTLKARLDRRDRPLRRRGHT